MTTYILSSSANTKNSHGGIKSLSDLIQFTLKDEDVFSLNPLDNKYRLFKSIFTNSNFIIIGYADKAIFFCLPLFIFLRSKIIYIPCFHPWTSMRRKLFARIYEKIIFKLFLRVKHVLCLSINELNYLKKLHRKGNYTFIAVPSPIIRNELKINRNTTRNTIIFVGRDDENKNMSQFITLAKDIKNIVNDRFEFLVISNSNRSFPEWIDIKKNVSEEELIQIYQRTLAIIITSKWESLSLVGIEAIICGGKVICNQNVMLGNFNSNFKTLILNNYNNINKVITFLQKEPEKYEQVIFSELFSKENFKNTFTPLMKEIIF